MARQRVVLQPPINIVASQAQSGVDAVPVGNKRSGVVFADAYAYGGTSYSIFIETISEMANATGQFSWIVVVTITVSAAGGQKVAITDLGEAVRWRVSGTPAGTNTMKLTVYFSDQP